MEETGSTTTGAAAVGISGSLIPSQVVNNNNNNRSRRRKKNNNKNDKEKVTKKKNDEQQNSSNNNDDNKNENNSNKKKPRKKNNNKKKSNNNKKKDNEDNNNDEKMNANNNNESKTNNKTKKKRRNNNNKKSKKRYPWRRFIPQGTVDPITLDPLVSLSYPPFALCADSPYDVVDVWPPPIEEEEKKDDEDERRRMEEQWGSNLPKLKDDDDEEKKNKKNSSSATTVYNLYDGRALAYYMVSQLQFIDPLNRRDLSRDELMNLDRYLFRHGFGTNFSVVDAYDAKGITMSSAGAAASTEAGRAEIRQQTAQALAQSLLSSLFAGGGPSTSPPTPNNSNNLSLQQQYAASTNRQQQQEQQRRRNRNNNNRDNNAFPNDPGPYGTEEGGLVIIDDDANPGLRGGYTPSHNNNNLTSNAPTFIPGTLWSGSRITGQFNSHYEASRHESNFPALTPSSSTTASASNNNTHSSSATTRQQRSVVGGASSRSLARITKVVAKTDPKQVQKQREAREIFVKRAAMSNLTFGAPKRSTTEEDFSSSGLMVPPEARSSSNTNVVTEGQLERNKALASALGVMPNRHQQTSSINQGWARNEYGNELSVTYPDSLVQGCRLEYMDIVLKVEKKWKVFLKDDTAASIDLKKMDRPLRKFIHEYSDFWKLHTESFDPEPHRYIHCVKLRDTSQPIPLLSDVARNWRPTTKTTAAAVVDLTQAAGQSPREFPPPPEREPLQLLKPSSSTSTSPSTNNKLHTSASSSSLNQHPSLTMMMEEGDEFKNPRSNELFNGKQRIKLDLAPRTLPTELPPLNQQNQQYNMKEERIKNLQRKEEEAKEKKRKETLQRQMLESVFASDDEEQSMKSHDSADWDDFESLEPVFVESEDEEEEAV